MVKSGGSQHEINELLEILRSVLHRKFVFDVALRYRMQRKKRVLRGKSESKQEKQNGVKTIE